MTLGEFRRRPTLPGRFQPSTISVLRLNFCVRDGNRWIPQAIVTGNMGLSSRSATLRVSLDSLRLRFPFLAPSKPHRSGSLRLTDQVRLRSPLTFFANHLVRAPVPGLIPAFRLRSRSGFGFSCSLFPSACSLSLQDQALDRLVSPSSIRYRTSTDDLSTLSSSRGLTCF